MTPFLRDHGLTLLLILAGIGAVSGWTRAAHYEGVAEAHEARADSEAERVDSIQAIRLQERRADSVRTAALRDSADARVRRAEEARRREARERERRERARARAVQAAADLRETLTPAQVPLFDAYEAERDIVEATLEIELKSVRTRLEHSNAENASLWVAMDAKDALYGITVDELARSRAEAASLRAANDARIQAGRSTGIFPDFGDLTKPVYIAAGALIGWGGAKLTGAR